MRAKKKTLFYFDCWLKKCHLLSHSLSPCLSLSHSLSSHLWTSSLSISLSQLRSLKLTFTVADPTHRQRRRHQSSTSSTHQSSQATDPCRWSPQTHFSFIFSLSLSPFLAPIESHITRLTSNRSIPFHFALIITVYDHWSMIGAGLVGRYWIGQSITHRFRFGCVDFFGFLFCSSSLVLIGTVGL